MSWEKWDKRAEKGPGALFFPILGIVIFLCVLGFVLNPFRQAGSIVNKTINADNVLYNYEWFKQQWRDVQAIDKKITIQTEAKKVFAEDAGHRKDWTFEDKTESSRLGSIITGLEMQKADMISKYNARANMANRQIFMGNDCPKQIN